MEIPAELRADGAGAVGSTAAVAAGRTPASEASAAGSALAVPEAVSEAASAVLSSLDGPVDPREAPVERRIPP